MKPWMMRASTTILPFSQFNDNSSSQSVARKMSVRELLPNFETKNNGGDDRLALEEETQTQQIPRRRVCSDTETLLYDTSSDEAPPLPLKCSLPPPSFEQEYLPMMNTKNGESFSVFGNIQTEDSHYVAMIPAKMIGHSSSTSALIRKKSLPSLPALSDPDEPSSIIHSRTPSQTLVMEHLQKEMNESQTVLFQGSGNPPPPPPPIEEDTYVDMNEDGTMNGDFNRKMKKKKQPILAPLESPRYCEIDESAVAPCPSHYEFLHSSSNNNNHNNNRHKSAEVLYHEIPEEHKSPLRPIEGLPDILGNNDSKKPTQLNVSDTFKPASFFLEHREKSLSLSKKVHHHSSSSSSSLRDRELPKTPTENHFNTDRALSHSNLSSTTPKATASTTEEDKESDKDDSKPLAGQGPPPPPPPHPPPPPPKVPYYVSDLHEQRTPITDESLARKTRRSNTPENVLLTRKEHHLNEGHLNEGFKPARGLEPPPPPEGIPPLDITRLSKETKSDDDYYWRENLRKASAQVISPPLPSLQSDSSHHHINGYIWDERSQRFYKLTNGGPSSKTQEQLKNQTFLGEGLPGTFSTNKKGRQSIITEVGEQDKFHGYHNDEYGEDCPASDTRMSRNNLEIQGPHILPHQLFREQQQQTQQQRTHHYNRRRRNRSADPSPIRSSPSITESSPGEICRPSSSASSLRSLIPISPSRVGSSTAGGGGGRSHSGGSSSFFYVCNGQGCSGSRCEFSASIRHWQSLIRLQDSSDTCSILGSESLNRLDESRKKLAETRDLLSKKLMSKQKRRISRNSPSPSSHEMSEYEREEDNRDLRQYIDEVQVVQFRRDNKRVSLLLIRKFRKNIWDFSSQDLLGKSHEELVLILIHLRRQSAALTEAIDASTAELENIIHSNEQPYLLVEDLRNHIRDLEEQHARGRPIVSLVDNMRRSDIQELLQRSLEVVRQNINEDKQLSKEERDSLVEEQKILENELSRVTNELETCQKKTGRML
ncbi:unnamed protein product [Lepeophtheirus salmonis]|uniref:(salmon louse) hypothetical protein n=1 Tax=Lepeophtheirus salmonis TaxID=72036 RepID=A0A7R8CYK2_LEPSM|nr:unnamed protein product [Lepeophtheirus salmonis]CAF2969429.1 unnamed protein product [Lepeophtheirus salmonis]